MEKVTLESLANSIEQLKLEVQNVVRCFENMQSSPTSVFKVFGSGSTTPNVHTTVPNNQVMQCSLEKAKTDSYIAKNGRTDSNTLIDLPGLELPSWVPVYFQPKASMGLDYNELSIAAYLYGTLLMYNDEEDIVFSSAITVNRDVFRSLLPGRLIFDEVLILVVDMMTTELSTKSGYWFLPPSFAVDERTRTAPTCLSFETTEVYMGKVDYLKRVGN